MKKIINYLFSAALISGSFSSIAQDKAAITITIDAKNSAQTIQNIGASGCWFSESIGKNWPLAKRQRMAELLFSKQILPDGTLKGIGLSAWRFNIGGGSAGQGDSSGIRNPSQRVECFLNPDGTYNWDRQAGYQWFLQKARDYKVENLIAFANTPPVQFTQNGFGFKTSKDYKSNLKADSYSAYADFLAQVIKHFDSKGLHFNFISPVNEPQWDWSGKPGQAGQEGSPWRNDEIYHVVTALNTSLQQNKLTTQILTPEAGDLTYLYSGKSASAYQIQQFHTDTSRYSFNKLSHVPRIVAGHSYFTENGDDMLINVRQHLADTTNKYDVMFWQSEYSMLADGFREGTKARRSQIDCALFLAKVIYHDFTVANATAWQFWNAWEPGNAEFDTRYYLLALKPNADYTDGEFSITKNLWALGNYSRFVRPGMKRLNINRGDTLTLKQIAQDVMVAAFTGGKDKLVLVAINYTQQARSIKPDLKNFKQIKRYRTYVTSANDNLKPSALQSLIGDISLSPRSVTTIIFD
ncbi:glycoside hydrolase [Mucilaginibacter sp. UR6-11]|uniref:glycoside hydrolase n=1 Tax=Mucilaginibacter sp. UR6-11 TaxID=1435644 RepID=UPI001E65ACB2|nr:beta-glycosidase [Mucilaginibacter sp. UR6-11]